MCISNPGFASAVGMIDLVPSEDSLFTYVNCICSLFTQIACIESTCCDCYLLGMFPVIAMTLKAQGHAKEMDLQYKLHLLENLEYYSRGLHG